MGAERSIKPTRVYGGTSLPAPTSCGSASSSEDERSSWRAWTSAGVHDAPHEGPPALGPVVGEEWPNTSCWDEEVARELLGELA